MTPGGSLATIGAARSALLDALAALPSIGDGSVGVRESEDALGTALWHLYRAMAPGGSAELVEASVIEALSCARRALGVLQNTPSGDPGLESALRRAAMAVGMLASTGRGGGLGTHDMPPETGLLPPLAASLGEPRGLRFARAPLRIVVPLPELDPPDPPAPAPAPAPAQPRDLAEVSVLVARAEAELERVLAPAARPPPEPDAPPRDLESVRAQAEELQIGSRLEEQAVIFGHARSMTEELAMLGLQRRPRAGMPWKDAGRIEARLLARLDGLASLGAAVVPQIVKLLEGRPVPDPELTWAVLFYLGCLAGDDAVDQLDSLLRVTSLEDLPLRESVGDALALSPLPGCERVLRPWLRSPDPARREVAVVALSRRGAMSGEEASWASQDVAFRVRLAAAHALGRVGERDSASALAKLLRSRSSRLVRAAMQSATLLGIRAGAERAWDLLLSGRPSLAGAVELVAVTGDREALPELRRLGTSIPLSPTVARAFGWYGHLDLVEPLLATLETEAPPGVKAAVAEALWRLTGAGVTDDDPEPEHPGLERPMASPSPIPERVAELSLQAEPWRAWWAAHGPHARRDLRHRFGRAWGLADDAWELSDGLSGLEDRQLALLELVARGGDQVALDLSDFAVRQELRIAAIRVIHAGVGEWPCHLT